MQIQPGGSIQNYLNRLRERTEPEDLRTSPRRADHLSRVGAILAMEDVHVRLDPAHPTATIDTSRYRPGRSAPDRWEITITSKGLPQPVTDYSREAYDLLAQETLLVHEIGHALYTDYETFHTVCDGLDPEHGAGFRLVFNAAEDVAVEEQLREQFSVAEELDVLNANLFEAIVPDAHEYTLIQAVELAILELGVWETGRLEGLLSTDAATSHARGLRFASARDERLFREEVFPLVRELVKSMKTTPDGETRVEHIQVFWEAFLDIVPESDSPGVEDAEEGSPANGAKPDDADPNRRGENRDADALEDNDASDVDERAEDALGEDGPESERNSDGEDGNRGEGDGGDADEEPPGADDAEESDPGEDGDADGVEGEDSEDSGAEGAFSVDLRESEPRSDEGADGDGEAGPDPSGERADAEDLEGGSPGGSISTSAELEEDYAEEVASDARSVGEDNETMADELEEMMAALEGADDEFAGVRLDVPTEAQGRYDEDAYSYAERVSGWIAQELGDRLRQEKRQRPIRRRTTGSLDRKRMTAWDRGDHRIFERTQEGGEKDYHAMFVADRSSSMGGAKIRMLERSIGGMAMGLEEIGVRTAVMDLYRDEGRLVKPFGVPVESRRSLMFSRDTSGSTPLGKIVAVARERLDAVSGNRFLVIVTDGQVGETESFKDQVDRCNFPVLGIYLAPGYESIDELTYFNSTFDYEGQLALFHRYRTVFDQNGLDRTLRELCKEVMF